MKTLSGLLLATALVATMAPAAFAYHFSPPDASVRLHGKLTFTPDEGGQPFACSVTLDLKTKSKRIVDLKFPNGHCEDVEFIYFPWPIEIVNKDSGIIFNSPFTSAVGNCTGDEESFQISVSGVWTLSGVCFSGTLTSRPATVIQ